MQMIEQHPYVEQVVPPMTGDSVAGPALGEDAALEFLEDEIMKIGALAHADIDWRKVESESLKILSDRSKDLKVLGFLLIALQRGGNGERFALSLYLLNRVLDTWWDESWPYPGDKGRRARKMLFNQMLQRADKYLAGMCFDASVGDGRRFCLELLTKLETQAQQRELPMNALADLKRGIEMLPRDQDSDPRAEPGAEGSATEPARAGDRSRTGAPPSIAPAAGKVGALTLDPGNERATRQSLLKVADMLTDTEPERPLGYQVRRYAIWQTITSIPPTRDGRRTDLAAVSADRVAEYREALEKWPDLALWQRIEQSLSVSPFWLDGHWLSATAASALGYENCAEAIRAAVDEFVERLPQLPELTFNDGTEFLSPEAQAWLWSVSTTDNSGSGISPWEKAYDTARDLVTQNGLAAGMQLLEDGLAEAREPREQFYWRLASARLMKASGLVSLANRQVRDLQQQIEGLAIEGWEPALFKQLERLA